jgi:hypothetical protein
VAILAEQIDGVIGVDTHRDTLAAAAVSPIGAVLASTDSPANARGYQRLLDFAREHVPGRRCWALEGIGSYGAGLAAFLDQAGEHVVEVCRPKRAANRGGRKTDMLDAIRAAKEALATEHLIQPRLRGEREALRVLLATRQGAVLASTAAMNQLKALIVSAPDSLRAELRKLKRPVQVTHCAQLRDRPAQDLEHRMTARALRSTAQRIQSLQAEAKDLEKEILTLVRRPPQNSSACSASGRSPLLRSWSAGLTRAGSARRLPSRPPPASRRSPPPPGSPTRTGSTAVETGSSTGRCTRSR